MVDEVGVRIRRFVVDNFLFGQDDPTLQAQTSLLDTGIVDSTGVLELEQFLEEEFGLPVPDRDLVPEHFATLAGLTAYVLRRLAARDE